MAKPRNVDRDRAIGARICLARILQKLNRPALGRAIGLGGAQVARYERGEVRVPASMLDDLGGALERGAAFFLATDGEALARAQTLDLPEPGSIARRHLDQALAVLDGGIQRPFGSAAPAQHGSEAA